MCSMCSLACCRHFQYVVVNTLLYQLKTDGRMIYWSVVTLSALLCKRYMNVFSTQLATRSCDCVRGCYWMHIVICGCEGQKKRNDASAFRIESKSAFALYEFWLWLTFFNVFAHFSEYWTSSGLRKKVFSFSKLQHSHLVSGLILATFT